MLRPRPVNVLLAEDNPINQEVAVGLLETLDCTVTVVENGRLAVDAAADTRFDLVLMDCQMPVMDGLEAARAIRKASADDVTLPIVALTADEGEDIRAACIAAGMNDLLGKPFTRQALQSLLQRWCPAAGGMPPPEPSGASETRPSTLDLKPIEALRSIDPDGGRRLVQRAIAKFLDYSDQLIARLADAGAEGDVSEVSRIAHSMKSSSANLGAADLARQCAEIEQLTGDGSMPEDIDGRIAALAIAHRRAKDDLMRLPEAG